MTSPSSAERSKDAQGWDRGDPSHLLPQELFWVNIQQWLESCGYMLRPRYRPGWVPSWRGTNKRPTSCEDGRPSLHDHLLDATRISDGKPVAIKKIRPHETEIIGFLCSEPLASNSSNHCTSALEILQVPDGNVQLIVMPLLRPYNDPMFGTVGEAMEFFRQVSEGLQFMHEHHVAHLNIRGDNIMMDATKMYPNGFHPIKRFKNRNFRGRAQHYTRSERPPKYLLIDFGGSQLFEPKDRPPLAVSISTDDIIVSNPLEDGDSEPSDPFSTDIYCLGNMIKHEFLDRYFGLDFIFPLVADMMQSDALKRPTVKQVVAHFEIVLRCLSTSQLRSRVVQRNSNRLRWYYACTHLFLRVRYVVQGIQPVPRPHPLADVQLNRAEYFLDKALEILHRSRDIIDYKEGMRYLEDHKRLKKQGIFLREQVKTLKKVRAVADARAYKAKVFAHYNEVMDCESDAMFADSTSGDSVSSSI